MGFCFQRRIRLGRGTYLNASGSGFSLSQRTSWGSIGARGMSIRAGIPGLTYRIGWGRKGSGSLVGLVLLAVYATFVMALVGYWAIVAALWLTYWTCVVAFQVGRWLVLTAADLVEYLIHRRQGEGDVAEMAPPPMLGMAAASDDGEPLGTVNSGTQQAVIDAAAAGMWRRLMPPDAFRRSVSAVVPYERAYGRALFQIERRDVVLKIAPTAASRHAHGEPSSPVAFDPWQGDPRLVPVQTRRVCTCPSCTGGGQVSCTDCAGISRVRCLSCNGFGRVASQRGSKVCRQCRGKGDVRCRECRAGRVVCMSCQASGVVEAWLEVERSVRRQVAIDGASGPDVAHAGLQDPDDFDMWSGSELLAEDSGTLRPPPPALPQGLLPSFDCRTERVLSVRIQRFVCPVYHVQYETAFGTGTLRLAGPPPAAAGQVAEDPLAQRRAVLVGAPMAAVALTLGVRAYYLAQHDWYVRWGAGTALLWLAAAIGPAVVVLAHQALLPPRARSRPWLVGGLVGAAACGVAITALCVAVRPHAGVARASLASGDLVRAGLEADAAREFAAERVDADAVADDVHLQRVQGAKTLDEQLQVLAEPWRRAGPQLPRATAQVASLVTAQAKTQEADAAWLAAIGAVLAARLPSLAQYGVATSPLGAAHDQIRLRYLHAVNDPTAMAPVVREAWNDRAVAQAARHRLVEAAEADAATRRSAGPDAFRTLRTAVAGIDEGLDQRTRMRVALAEAEGCIANNTPKCATEQFLLAAKLLPEHAEVGAAKAALTQFLDEGATHVAGAVAREKEPRRRVQKLEEARQFRELRGSLGLGALPAFAKLDSSIERARAAVQRLEAKEARQAARVNARQLRAVTRRARAEREATRGLLCCDGTLSPSCLCRGSRRGCCSHHGGVCGCEQL